ncbi:AGAP008948-PA-like protein [Anopheles sinensis]|uniref:Serine/threonine-protein kinase 40 n=1 Tax=Anopheles sinensis TaxID=74873 RepID=A0A084WQF8_ANOSI|nr:AGAP008948-PA-like protein [Anopheles sinensis]
MFRARKQLGKRQTAESSNGFRPKKFRTDQQVPTFQVGGGEEGGEGTGREGDDGTANVVGRFGRRIVRGRTGNVLLDCEIPRYGTPVERKHCRKAGDYVIGHELGTSPGVPQTQYLARKQGTDEYYLLKILSFDPETEIVDKEALQGKVLLHNEYTLLSMLDDLDGVIHQHGFFSDYAFEERQIETGDGTMQSIYTGRIRRRLILVLDCVHAHEFCDRSADFISLQRYITVTKYTELEALQLFYEVVKVVEKLHARNIIHRDLKLNNIVLNRRTKRVVLTNFFLGKQLINERELLFDQRGSPAYISPDVLAGKPYRGKPSDIWALGVILYTIIYGKFPFLDTTPTALFRKIREVDYVIPAGFKTSEATNNLIRCMLKLNPDDRFTAFEVRMELHQMLLSMRPVKHDVDQLVPELPESPGESTAGDHSIPNDRDSHIAASTSGRPARSSASAMVGEPMDVVVGVAADTPAPPVTVGSGVPATPKYELSTEAFSRVLETKNQQRFELGADGGGFPKSKQLGGAGGTGAKKLSSSIRTTPCIYPLLFPFVANGSTPSATGALQQVSRSMSQAGTPVGAGGGGGVQRNRFNFNLNVQYSPRSYNGIGGATSGPGIGVEFHQSGSENSNTSSSESSVERNTLTAPSQPNPVSPLPPTPGRASSMNNLNQPPDQMAQMLPPAAQRLYAIMNYISHVRGCTTSTPTRGATDRPSGGTGGDTTTGGGGAVGSSAGLEFNGVITQEIADKIVSFLIVNMRHHAWVVNLFRSNANGTGGIREPAQRVNNLLELLRQLGVRMEARNGQIVIRADQTRERHQFLGIMLRLAGINDSYFVQPGQQQQQQPAHPQELAGHHPLA